MRPVTSLHSNSNRSGPAAESAGETLDHRPVFSPSASQSLPVRKWLAQFNRNPEDSNTDPDGTGELPATALKSLMNKPRVSDL